MEKLAVRSKELGGDGTALAIRGFMAEADRRGLRTDELLARANLRRAQVMNPIARLRREEGLGFVERCVEACGDPLFHVEAILRAPHGAFGPLDFIMTMSPTVRDGARRCGPAYTLADSGVRVVFEEDDGSGPHFRVWSVFEPRPHFVDIEGLAAVTVSRTGMATAGCVVSCVFNIASRGCDRELSEALGCEVRYERDAKETIVRLHPERIDLPSRIAHPALAQLISVPIIASQTIGDRVVDVLVAGIPLRKVALRWVAECLGMPERTLRKKLRLEGLTFRALLTRARERLRRQLAAHGTLPVREIAGLLGYTPGGLRRAARTD